MMIEDFQQEFTGGAQQYISVLNDPETERGGQASGTADENAKLLSNRAEDGAYLYPTKFKQRGHYNDMNIEEDTDNVSTKPNR